MKFNDVPMKAIDDLPAGQISEPECKMLYWLASEIWTGEGEIVEIGSLYGKSTVCLARGVKANPCVKVGQLHAYDRWTVDDENAYMMTQLKKGYRGSFKHIFDANTAPYSDAIVTHQGDVCEAAWDGKPIEILFIDCSVSVDLHEAIFRKFFPFLQTGSIVIHQDYFFYRSYYLPLMMARLSPYMVETGNADTSMVYQVLKPIDKEMFDRPLVTSSEGIVFALQTLIKHYGGATTQHGGMIASMLIYYYNHIGQKERAAYLFGKVMDEADEKITQPVMRNLKNAMEIA